MGREVWRGIAARLATGVVVDGGKGERRRVWITVECGTYSSTIVGVDVVVQRGGTWLCVEV